MKKIIIAFAIILLMIMGACSVTEQETRDTESVVKTVLQTSKATMPPEISSSPTPEPKEDRGFDQYAYYNRWTKVSGEYYLNDEGEYTIEWVEIENAVPAGIYRYNSDGTDEELWLKGEIGLIGYIDDWMYCIDYDNNYEIFKVDVTGQERQAVEGFPSTSEIIMIDGVFYYHHNQLIYQREPDEAAVEIAKIPDHINGSSIMNLYYSNGKIFYKTRGSWPEFWHLYVCDLETGKTELLKEDIDENYTIDDKYVYHIGNFLEDMQKYNDGEIYRYNVTTGEEELLFQTGHQAYDLNIINDWLVYLTAPAGINY